RIGQAHRLEQLELTGAGSRAFDSEVDRKRLRELVPDGQRRVERQRRALRDVRDAASPQVSQLRVRLLQQVDVPELRAAGDDLAPQRAVADRGERGRRLAATRLAREAHDDTALERERDAVDDLIERAVVFAVPDREAGDLENRLG